MRYICIALLSIASQLMNTALLTLQDSLFYELCNAAGLYVIDEANIETHGLQPSPGGGLSSDPLWLKAFMLRLTRMWERDHCHPCIIAWSLGNESGYGSHHDAMAEWVRNTDPSRLVVYEQGMLQIYGGTSGGQEHVSPTNQPLNHSLC